MKDRKNMCRGNDRSQDAREKFGAVVLKGFVEGIDLTARGRLASNQFVHVCTGSPIPFSKVPGQGSFLRLGIS